MRILLRVAESGLPVLIRAVSLPEIAVKGRATAPGEVLSGAGMKLTNISEKGRAHIALHAPGGVQIEFVLMSTKIVFYTHVLMVDENSANVAIPSYLLSIERRKDGRFPVTTSARAYLRVHSFQPDLRDLAAPPYFEHQRLSAGLIHVGDVSMGGISLISRFPAITRIFARNAVIDMAEILFPLSAPLHCSLEVRWTKKIRDGLPTEDGKGRMTRLYKFGIRFIDPKVEVVNSIQAFIHRLSQADAI